MYPMLQCPSGSALQKKFSYTKIFQNGGNSWQIISRHWEIRVLCLPLGNTFMKIPILWCEQCDSRFFDVLILKTGTEFPRHTDRWTPSKACNIAGTIDNVWVKRRKWLRGVGEIEAPQLSGITTTPSQAEDHVGLKLLDECTLNLSGRLTLLRMQAWHTAYSLSVTS